MNYKKLRRSGRISKSVPILLIGSDTEGRVFSEHTRTVVVSLHGAGVVSAHKLLAEQELILRSLETNREAEIRVVGEIGEQGDKHTYGVAFLEGSIDFWRMEFPPPPSVEERPLELPLECTACGTTVTLLNGDFEFDVCAIHGGLVKYCAECGFATVWKRPEPGDEARAPRRTLAPKSAPKAVNMDPKDYIPPRETIAPVVDENLILGIAWDVQPLADSVPPRAERNVSVQPRRGAETRSASESRHSREPRAATAAIEDRRGRVRAKVNYYACVRSEVFGDDVVMCIDMSRGGVGFRTKNAYAVPSDVTIAVPFSPESQNAPAIFVPARVVNIRELPEQKMFRCGVMFLPAAGTRALK